MEKQKEFSFEFAFVPHTARGRMLFAVIMWMLTSHTSLHFFVSSFVSACVASEDKAYELCSLIYCSVQT